MILRTMSQPPPATVPVGDLLTMLCREGAKKMLATALEAEVQEYLDAHAGARDEAGRRLVVRNGYLPEREIQSGIGALAVKQPRVDDGRPREDGERHRFTSAILPPYLRRTKSMEELIPWLYLKGISTGDFAEALQALVGPNAPGLSATTIVRLKAVWQDEYKAWSERSLKGKRYVYIWADGVYFNVRLGDGERQCILVIMGATLDGKKELLAVEAGVRESELSWTGVLLDLKARGLDIAPKLAVGDGALGFWAALSKVFPTTRWQRCWVHKTANVLNQLPKSLHAKAKELLKEIYLAATKAAADKAFDHFLAVFEAKHPKAAKCLTKDREALLAFYDFPAEHWVHVRTTNPIESTFATVRLRTTKTKGCGSAEATLMMVFKLGQSAERGWRRLTGSKLLADVIDITIKFVDGVKMAA